MKTSRSSKLSAFLIIILMMFMMIFLASCEGYTWKYHTIVEYHYEGETETHVVTHDNVFSYNSNVEEIQVRAYANSFELNHKVVLIYEVMYNFNGVNRTLIESYDIMNVPDKAVVIDNVKTVRTSKTK